MVSFSFFWASPRLSRSDRSSSALLFFTTYHSKWSITSVVILILLEILLRSSSRKTRTPSSPPIPLPARRPLSSCEAGRTRGRTEFRRSVFRPSSLCLSFIYIVTSAIYFLIHGTKPYTSPRSGHDPLDNDDHMQLSMPCLPPRPLHWRSHRHTYYSAVADDNVHDALYSEVLSRSAVTKGLVKEGCVVTVL